MAFPIGAAIQGVTSGLSLIQGINARKDAKDATRAAQEAMRQARQKAEVNYLESLRVPTEAFERQFDAGVARQQQAMEGLRESGQRAVAAGVGRVNIAQDQADFQTRQAMADRLYNLEQQKAIERGNIRDEMVDMDLAQAMEQNIRAAELGEQSAGQITSGVLGLGGAAATTLESMPLFKNQAGRTSKAIESAGFNSPGQEALAARFDADEMKNLRRMSRGGVDPFASVGSMQSQSFVPMASFSLPNFE
jgi:hypothetical protein